MPTYDYQCDECGHEFELFQQMSAPVKRKCPECGLLKLRRLIGTGAGVLFKGSGFYETDYRSDSYKSGAKQEKDAAETKSEQSEGAGEKKADKKEKTDSTKTAASKDATPKSKPASEGAGSGKAKSD